MTCDNSDNRDATVFVCTSDALDEWCPREPTPPRQLAREVIANLITSSQAPADITAKAIMQALERQHLAIFAKENDSGG